MQYLDQVQAHRFTVTHDSLPRCCAVAIRRCLATWFSPGLLQLRRVTWDNSSAALLVGGCLCLAPFACLVHGLNVGW
jgi:hypothetical protein